MALLRPVLAPWLAAAALLSVTAPACKGEGPAGAAAGGAGGAGSPLAGHEPAPAAPAAKPDLPSLESSCSACAPDACPQPAADSCYQLGLRYESGEGAPQDLARAKDAFSKAARGGHAAARGKVRAAWGGI